MISSIDDRASQARGIVALYFHRPLGELTLETRLREDLGADSLNLVELLFMVEGDMGIVIPDEVAADLRTIGDVVRYVESVTP